MKKHNILKRTLLLTSFVTFLFFVSCIIYATQIKENKNYKDAILTEYKKEKIETESEIETEVIEDIEVELPKISENSQKILKTFDKDISKYKDIKKVYDSILDRSVTRMTSDDFEIDFDDNGDIVSYKNLEDYSTKDKDKKDYKENEKLDEIEYKFNKKSDLSDIISTIEENDLAEYKLIECSNEIESVWVLTWCKEYSDDLINSYDCVNVVIDAKDGSIMLFGKNDVEPNTLVPIVTQDEAIELAKSIISEYTDEDVDVEVKLTIFKPNFYFEDGGPYESADFVRLSWEVSIEDTVNVQVDAETGEILGGGDTQSVSARAMSTVAFPGQQERASLASSAFSRLGYSQVGYPPVYWSISQTDINWMLSRSDMYGLYLLCHGGVINGVSVLADSSTLSSANWQIWSNTSFGVWRFVYLDACLSSSNNNFVNAFHAYYSGECFVGWNVSVNTYTALDFDRRFFPRLGSMTVLDAVVTSLWESRNAGYNTASNICDPGFIGDINYYGWAW